jgi:Tfp pilus assembly protein PilV
MKFLNKKGDTIVEVMIAVVVLGAALGGAFAVSNSASQRTYDNHERYQALQYASQQIEYIRQETKSVNTSDTNYYNDRRLGCFKDATAYTVNNNECIKDSIYTIATNGEGSSKKFTILVTWDTLGGGEGRVELVYAVE